jgi:hypothetical protein
MKNNPTTEVFVPGHRVTVQEVFAVYKATKSIQKTASHFRWPETIVRDALRAEPSATGMLARYARPKHKRTFDQSVGKYLGALDSETRK